jgi:glycosyltransferase involved in cell wall biosynthesis
VFRERFTGGWLFNSIKALALAGVRTVLVYPSARVARPERFIHRDTGAPVWILPSPAAHRAVRRLGQRIGPNRPALAAVSAYLSTPAGALARVLRQEGCEAILCQEYENPRFDVCVLLGRVLGLPVFATHQGAGETGTRLERPFRRLSLRRGAGLIVAARAEAARVRRAYGLPPEAIAAIPNPVDVFAPGPDQRLLTRARLGFAPAARVVAWHGRVQIDKKGLDLLLDAWDRIGAARPDADYRLLLVGSGRNAEALRQRLASSRRVTWIDRYVLDRAELWDYLGAADVYAIPSRREGYAVAVLEAMAVGLPAVASDAPGVAEVLTADEEDGGLLVPSEDIGALATGLLRFLDDPESARRIGDAARQRIAETFSLEVIGPQLRRFLFPSPAPLSKD